MNIDLTKPWREIFAEVAEAKAEEKRQKRDELMLEELDREDREKRRATEKQEKKKKEEERADEQMLATVEHLADFSSRLDDLDTASVEALMHNGEALDQVRVKIDAMLDRADKLPDGRHIFKTEDGTRVVDENGAEIPANVIDPHSIDDRHARWEQFKPLREEKLRVEAERHEILDYQSKLDRVHARLDKGGLTNKDVDELDADLQSTMPPAVRETVGHRGAEASGPRAEAPDPAAVQLWERQRSGAPIGPSPT